MPARERSPVVALGRDDGRLFGSFLELEAHRRSAGAPDYGAATKPVGPEEIDDDLLAEMEQLKTEEGSA